MTIERGVKHGYEDLTILERVLQLHGQFRRSLEPLGVTPLQAGVILFLRRHADANVTDAATVLGVSQATLSRTVITLVRKQWVAKRRSAKDDRVVALSLSRRMNALALQINQRVRQMNATLTEQDRKALGMTPEGRRA